MPGVGEDDEPRETGHQWVVNEDKYDNTGGRLPQSTTQRETQLIKTLTIKIW